MRNSTGSRSRLVPLVAAGALASGWLGTGVIPRALSVAANAGAVSRWPAPPMADEAGEGGPPPGHSPIRAGEGGPPPGHRAA